MFNFSENNNNCTMPAWYWRASEAMFPFTYQYFAVVYFVFGLTGDAICLLVCCQEAKKEAAYSYQVFLTVSHICEIITGGISYAGSGLYGMIGHERTGPAADWYRSSYLNIFYFAHLASPTVNSFITSSLLLSVCTTADRVLAVAKPFAYRLYNHRMRRACCIIFSFLLGFATSAFDVFRRAVKTDLDGKYSAIFDTAYTSLVYVKVLSHLRNVLRVLALVTLISLNAALVYFYKSHLSQVHQTVGGKNENATVQKRQLEKTLLILAVYQSISTTASMSFLIIYYFLFYGLPGFSTCAIFLMGPVTDFAVAFVYAFDFYAILIMSKRFRKLTLRCFLKEKKPTETTATPLELNHRRTASVGHY